MIEVTVEENGGPTQMAAELPSIVEDALSKSVMLWHGQMMPGHFTEQGFDKYQYQPRKGQNESNMLYRRDVQRAPTAADRRSNRLIPNPHYYWRKWRQKGTHDPLVFSGTSKRQAQQSIRISTKTVKGRNESTAKGVLNLPRYFYQYRTDQGAPDKANELTRVTQDEATDLSETMAAAVEVGLRSVTGNTRHFITD